MHHGRLFAFAVFLTAVAPSLCAREAIPSLAALQSRIAGHVSQLRFAGAAWGIKIVALNSGETVYELNANKLLKPASNAKLFTAALALDRLGADYRSKTSVYQTGRRAGANLEGHLIIYGRGDPSFSARFHQGDPGRSLEGLINAILKTGITNISGDLIGDESYFRGPAFGAGWSLEDIEYPFGAEVSSLSLEDNVLEVVLAPGREIGDPCALTLHPPSDWLNFRNRTRTAATPGKPSIAIYRPVGARDVYLSGELPIKGGGSYTGQVTVLRPAAFFVRQLRQALEARGCHVAGREQVVNWLDLPESPEPGAAAREEIASVNSPPLAEIVPRMLKPSQNLYAQLLLLQVGALVRGPDQSAPPSAGGDLARGEAALAATAEAGLGELKKFLRKIGINDGDVLLDEGSGLSRTALVKPAATVELLRAMRRHPAGRVFYEALPIAGVDGTLRARMRGTAAAGNARAKTGSLRFQAALSGYATTAGGEELAFSLMLNNFSDSHGGGAEALDTIVAWLADYNGKGIGK